MANLLLTEVAHCHLGFPSFSCEGPQGHSRSSAAKLSSLHLLLLINSRPASDRVLGVEAGAAGLSSNAEVDRTRRCLMIELRGPHAPPGSVFTREGALAASSRGHGRPTTARQSQSHSRSQDVPRALQRPPLPGQIIFELDLMF